MPDLPDAKLHPHPVRVEERATGAARPSGSGPAYAELHCKSNFSFLRGASHPEELVETAAALGYRALAVTDRNSLAGVVRMHLAAKQHRLKLVVGAEIVPVDSPPVVLLAPTRAAYGRLSRLITMGRRRAIKGECRIAFEDVVAHAEGLMGISIPCDLGTRATKPRSHQATEGWGEDVVAGLCRYREVFGERGYLAAELCYGGDDETRLERLGDLSRETRLPLVAANDVHYHVPERRYLHDVLTCIRHQCSIHEAGRRLLSNARRHLLEPHDVARRLAACPDAVARTVAIADACTFSLDELRYEYPRELSPPGVTPMEYLSELTWAGARERYGERIPAHIRGMLEHELRLIRELHYEPYFLTVWDLVRFARSRGILCQGRGSAANSAVCYCLGITAVDPAKIDLLFERFVSRERNEPPDIDVDFEHERREEVFQYIYDKYGRDRAAITAEVITYRPRSAVRDVGKALGLSLDCVDALAKRLEWWDRSPLPEQTVREAGFDPGDRTLRMLVGLVRQLMGFPRHLSQHVGGFVMTEGPLCETVPIENGAMPDRTFIEWDKDDLDALGMLKVDCLALGMLTCIQKCFSLLGDSHQAEGKATKVGKKETGARYADQNVSGFDCVAEGDATREAGLSGDNQAAGVGAVRADDTNAPGGRLDTDEHRRGARRAEPYQLPSLSQDREKLAGRTPHSTDPCRRDRCSQGPIGTDRTSSRNGPGSPRPHQKSGNTREVATTFPSSLRGYVASSLSLHTVPAEDPVVYDMICAADTVGVFQIESRAQMSMLPRLRPRNFYDLVIEVAIVRPGPIQGGMVHPYLRRRNGEEPVTYPNRALEEVLGKTLGVPLFQEQAMRLAVVAAGFTPGEADQLRRAMGAWRRSGDLDRFGAKLKRGMLANGYDADFAERCFRQISGFGEYGFPESHAASFSLLVYVSAWLKRYHPAAFAAALLNSQPMGFYTPAQIVRDARNHGVPVLPPDVNCSGYDCTLDDERIEGLKDRRTEGLRGIGTEGKNDGEAESWGRGGPRLRLGLRLIRGISREKVRGIEAARREGTITSIHALARRDDVSRETLLRLAAADAFGSLGLNRREALWRVLALSREAGLFASLEPKEARPLLPELDVAEQVVGDYDTIGMSLRGHPISLVRAELERMGVRPNAQLKQARHGERIAVSGLVLVRQRPGTANGIVFVTLEDETGIANLVVRPRVWQCWRHEARTSVALVAHGVVERQGDVIHVMVMRMTDLSSGLDGLGSRSRDFH